MTEIASDLSEMVEKVRDLLSRATPGPWKVGIWNGDKNRKHVVDMLGKRETTFAMLTDRSSMFPPSAIVHSDGDRCEVEANAELIALSHDMAAELERLTAENARMGEALKRVARRSRDVADDETLPPGQRNYDRLTAEVAEEALKQAAGGL